MGQTINNLISTPVPFALLGRYPPSRLSPHPFPLDAPLLSATASALNNLHGSQQELFTGGPVSSARRRAGERSQRGRGPQLLSLTNGPRRRLDSSHTIISAWLIGVTPENSSTAARREAVPLLWLIDSKPNDLLLIKMKLSWSTWNQLMQGRQRGLSEGSRFRSSPIPEGNIWICWLANSNFLE